MEELQELSIEQDLIKFELDPHVDSIRHNTKDVLYDYNTKHLEYYRRRKLPRYLLNYDRTDYSRYASKDDISIAYLIRGLESLQDDANDDKSQVITTINTVVHLINYTDLIKKSNNVKGLKKQVIRSQNEFNFEIELTLINSVNECIKKIVREAFFTFGIEMKKKDKDKSWGLRLYNFEEFMYGDIPLINYYTVQKLIRNYKNLEVLVVEIPRNGTNHQNFPPIYELPKVISL